MGWYAALVTRRPCLLIVFDIVLVAACAPLVLWKHGLPSFDDPRQGFDARGTSIRGREHTAFEFQRRIMEGNLTVIPAPNKNQHTKAFEKDRDKRNADVNDNCLHDPIVFDHEKKSPRMVVQSTNKSSLLDINQLKAICSIETEYISTVFNDSCPGHSLPYYVGALANKTSCSQLTQGDVEAALGLLQHCAKYFFNESLTKCYRTSQCSGIPAKCTQYHAVYKIFNFFTDVNFMKDGDVSLQNVTYSQIIFREKWLARDEQMSDIRDYFLTYLDNLHVISKDGLVESLAMDMLIEILIFNDYVISDLPFYALAMGLVLLVIVMYMRSLVLTLVIVVVVGSTLIVGYFFYFMVFQLPFFPFINILAALLCIAVGADDVFILRDIWSSFSVDDEGSKNDVEKVVSLTLKHGSLTLFVTSLTTAAALFANCISPITSLKCFSLFAGTCILLNFFFMITLIPPILVLQLKCKVDCYERCLHKTNSVLECANTIWTRGLPRIVIGFRFVWLILFFAIGAIGVVLVFFRPALSLPTSKDMKIFYHEHPFEVYRDLMKDKFRYELELQNHLEYNVNIQFLWGLNPVDNGNWMDPTDNGTIVYDYKFDITSMAAQVWMKDFCTNLLRQEFIEPTENGECFFERFEKLVTVPCETSGDSDINRISCCDLSFPLNSSMANVCLQDQLFLTNMHLSAHVDNKTIIGIPVYEIGVGRIIAFTFVLPTVRKWTTLHSTMNTFYHKVEDFTNHQLEYAPNELKGGWWCGAMGELSYYNLQTSLADGTFMGMGLSLAVGSVILLVTCRNLLITIYSVVSIILTISTTVGVLVLLGWELGFFESITITLAVGLSIDFNIHYGVAYLLSGAADRHERVKEALVKVGAAVSMAALTTFVAGSAVMGGRVLGYRNFGVFLMVVMTVSWAFATFFFLPLCACIGPLGTCGNVQHIYRKLRARILRKPDRNNTSNGLHMGNIPNGQVIVASNSMMKNSYEPGATTPRSSFSRPSYFQPLKDESSLKEISRPSRLAHHNMNSNESIFNSDESNSSNSQERGVGVARRPTSSSVSENEDAMVWPRNEQQVPHAVSTDLVTARV